MISGVPQGTVLGPLLFLILMSDIDIGVLNAKVVADDTWLYSKILYVEDCDSLQSDLNCVYDWTKTNNMVFNSQKNLFLQMYLLLVIMLMLMLAQIFMLLTMSII